MQSGLTTVVVVGYRSLSTLPRCLDAVLASTVPVQLIVVDNASNDGTVDWLAERMRDEPRLSVLANDDNLGFAVACNQGARLAQGDVVFLLNPDAYVSPDTIQRLRTVLTANPPLGLLGCAVVDEAGRCHGPQRRREPTARRSLMSLIGLDRWQQRWPALAGIEQPAADRPDDVEFVDAVNGSAMLVPADLYRRLGGMDEGFTLHAEDLDLCRRIRDAGLRVGHAGQVRTVHEGGVSSRSRPLWVEWQKTRSLWRYFRKHEPSAALPLRVAVILGLAARLALKAPMAMLGALRR